MESLSLDKHAISEYLEITDPFLMVDHVDQLIPGKSARGFKDLAANAWFFKCHLQREQAMPGTLLTEAMLQTSVLAIYTRSGHKGKFSFITDIRTKLLKKVSPGQPLVIQANILSTKRGITKAQAICTINAEPVCEGEFTFVSPHELPAMPARG